MKKECVHHIMNGPEYLKVLLKYGIMPFIALHVPQPFYMKYLSILLAIFKKKKPEDSNEPSTKTST